jgi:hypothetical protein
VGPEQRDGHPDGTQWALAGGHRSKAEQTPGALHEPDAPYEVKDELMVAAATRGETPR